MMGNPFGAGTLILTSHYPLSASAVSIVSYGSAIRYLVLYLRRNTAIKLINTHQYASLNQLLIR